MIPVAAAAIEAKRQRDAFVPSWDKPPHWDWWFENVGPYAQPCDRCSRRAEWLWIEWGPSRTATLVKKACGDHRD